MCGLFLDFAFSPSGYVEFLAGRGSGFLDETVQKEDRLVPDEEDRPSDTGRQARADFPEAISERIHERQSQRPAKLHGFDVAADLLPLVFRQFFQPFTNGLVPRHSPVKGARKRARF